MNQKHDKKEDKMKDKNEKNESESEFHSLSFFCLHSLCIHFAFSLFTFTLCFLCSHSLCVFFVYIHFVCCLFTFTLCVFFLLVFSLLFHFDFLHEQVKMSAQLQAFPPGSLAAGEWYIVVISIEADMIIVNTIWKKTLFQTVKLAWNEQVKKNWKRQLTEQIKSDNKSNFQNMKIEKLKY